MPVTSAEILARQISNQINKKNFNDIIDLSDISKILYELSDTSEVLNHIEVDKLKILVDRFSRKYGDAIYYKKVDKMTKEELVNEINTLVKSQKYYIDFEIDAPANIGEIMLTQGCDRSHFGIYIYRMTDIERFDEIDYDKKVLCINAEFQLDIKTIFSEEKTYFYVDDLEFIVIKTSSNTEFIDIVKFIKKNMDVLSIFFNKTIINRFYYHDRIIKFLEEEVEGINSGKITEDHKVTTLTANGRDRELLNFD